jgi:hypothetical protein
MAQRATIVQYIKKKPNKAAYKKSDYQVVDKFGQRGKMTGVYFSGVNAQWYSP